MNSLKFKSSRLALAVLAAGVVGGAGVTAVRGFSTPVFAQQPAVVATAAAPGPIGVVTALLGAPFFLVLLMRLRRKIA